MYRTLSSGDVEVPTLLIDWSMTMVAIGRFLIGAVFVVGGLRHLPVFSATIDRFRVRGVPLPAASLVMGTLFQIVVGAMLAFGLMPQISAIGLIVFTVAASVIVHNFWDMAADARRMALFWWQSNTAIVGGLIVVGWS